MKKKKILLPLLLVAIAASAWKMADDIISRLGMQYQSAQANIISNLVGNFSSGPMNPYDNEDGGNDQSLAFRLPYAPKLSTIISGDKAAAAKELCEYIKDYIKSEDFLREYNVYRENAMPLTSNGADMGTLRRNKIVFEKNINNYKTDLKYVTEQQKLMDENQKKIDAITESAKKNFPGKANWEKKYPVDPSILVKKRLQEYLQLSATVDFNAALTPPDKYRVKKFINPVYEKKSLKWKAIYRGGKEVNEVVTAFVKNWLKEETVPANKPKTTPVVQKAAPVTATQSNQTITSNAAAATGEIKYDLISRDSSNKVVGTFFESWEPGIDKAPGDRGRYVVFISQAKGLCGSTGKFRQIFWRDRQTGQTKMISRSSNGEEGNGNSFAPVISVGSIYVAFESYATNLVNDDNNSVRDVFLWRNTLNGGEVERVSMSQAGTEGNSESFEPSISGMGGHVVFTSNASNLTAEGTEVSGVNVYLWEKHNKKITLISKDYKTGKGVGGSKPSIDMNGYKIAFYSFAYTLVPNDNNNLWDIFLYQRDASLIGLPLKRITMAYDGGERNQGDESSSRVITPTISGINGRYITYATTASNVVPDDNNKAQDVFVYDSESNTTVRASVDNNGIEGNGDSPQGQGEKIDITGNGNIVVFTTKASNFGTPANNVVMYNLQTKKMIPVSSVTGTYVSTPSVSRDGKYVAFGCGSPLDKRFNSSGLFVTPVNFNPSNQ